MNLCISFSTTISRLWLNLASCNIRLPVSHLVRRIFWVISHGFHVTVNGFLLAPVWKFRDGVLQAWVLLQNICSKETGEFCALSWARTFKRQVLPSHFARVCLLLRFNELRVTCRRHAGGICSWSKIKSFADCAKQVIHDIADVFTKIIRAALFLSCGASFVWYLLMPMLATLDTLLTEFGPFEIVLLVCSGCTVFGASIGAAHSLYCKFSAQKNRRRKR